MSEQIKAGQLFPGSIRPSAVRQTHVHPASRRDLTQSFQSSFKQVLAEQVLKFSHHAEMRLKQRGIALKPEQLHKLEEALDKAAAKGARDSLLVVQDMAFIVNVKSRTVVTALDGDSMKNNVFTQIDSAVIIQ